MLLSVSLMLSETPEPIMSREEELLCWKNRGYKLLSAAGVSRCLPTSRVHRDDHQGHALKNKSVVEKCCSHHFNVKQWLHHGQYP